MAFLRLFSALLAIAVLPLTAAAEAPPAPPPAAATSGDLSSLEGLVARALRDNPGLRAQRANLAAAQQRPSQARALPDPTADIEFMNLAVDGSSGSKSLTEGVSVGVTQMLPFPGKRDLAAKAAQGEVSIEEARLILMERELRAEVLEAAYRSAMVRDLLQLNDRRREALSLAASGALSRYAAGAASQSEVLSAQSAVTRAAAERHDLESQRDIVRARLENLLAGPVDAAALEELELAQPAPLPPLAPLLARAGERAPAVAVAQTEAELAERLTEAVQRSFKPDFMVGGRYRFNDMTMGGKDYVTAMFGMTLPYFHRKDRYGPALEEAVFRREGAREGTRQAENDARYALAEAYRGAARAIDLLALYDQGLLPQARQTYEASLWAYQTGRADFDALLTALTDLFGVQSEAVMARADYHEGVAAMEAILGGPLAAPPRPSDATPPHAQEKP